MNKHPKARRSRCAWIRSRSRFGRSCLAFSATA